MRKKNLKPQVAGVKSPSLAANPSTSPSSKTRSQSPAIEASDGVVWLLALMMFLAPTLGVPHEEMLQDTLKSIIVSGLALAALWLFVWQQRGSALPLRWHGVVWLPLALTAYALGSMVWSHTYLGGAEAIRWWVFGVIVWLGLNTVSRARFSTLAWGIHLGALGAALWTALQFWVDLKLFPQGPNPASTFVNRNFVAEFIVCTLPLSLYLLVRARQTAVIALLSFTTGFNGVALLMTGTRSALMALGVELALLPVLWVVYQRRAMRLSSSQLTGQSKRDAALAPPLCAGWSFAQRGMAAGVLMATVLVLGSLPTGNASLVNEAQGMTPIARSFSRATSVAKGSEYTDGSFSVRWLMWSSTFRMIAAHPLAGVGAGAWEVQAPLFQADGAQIETDYYVHNEVLQLLAEYGLVGWGFLLALIAYLVNAAWRCWRATSAIALSEMPLRLSVLLSLLSFLLVSNAGFPWRLAVTGAFFAVCLGALTASDARLALAEQAHASGAGQAGGEGVDDRWISRWLAQPLSWNTARANTMLALSTACLVLCVYISQQAAQAESAIVRAVKTSLTISESNQFNHPHWKEAKAQMFALLREGIAITPHYRKLTPMVADEVAKWGDWADAVWIWETLVPSRPYVIAIMSNIARGYALTNQPDKAQIYLERCKKLQPNAPAVRSLEVIMLTQQKRNDEAWVLTKRSFEAGIYDFDLVRATYTTGVAHADWALALKGMETLRNTWPQAKVESWMNTGQIYANPSNPGHDDRQALAAFQQAYDTVADRDKNTVLADMPAALKAQIRVH